jgi:uncharacterized protein YerC
MHSDDMVGEVETAIRNDSRVRSLCDAIAIAATDPELLLLFVRDLTTPAELRKMANRWTIATVLMAEPAARYQGRRSQAEIASLLKVAPGVVNDVAKWATGIEARGGFQRVYRTLHSDDDRQIDSNH